MNNKINSFFYKIKATYHYLICCTLLLCIFSLSSLCIKQNKLRYEKNIFVYIFYFNILGNE